MNAFTIQLNWLSLSIEGVSSELVVYRENILKWEAMMGRAEAVMVKSIDAITFGIKSERMSFHR